MDFCPVCKRLLILKEERGAMIGSCSCGFKRTCGINISSEENNDLKSSLIGEGVVSEFNDSRDGFFRICSKCGFDKASAFQITSNESEVTIFKCLKCNYSVRQSQGGSKA
jgi:DNA-directed RNA polymerase subunit M/transcription elongation factor TFIIS